MASNGNLELIYEIYQQLDKEIIDEIFEQKQGNVEETIEYLSELTEETQQTSQQELCESSPEPEQIIVKKP